MNFCVDRFAVLIFLIITFDTYDKYKSLVIKYSLHKKNKSLIKYYITVPFGIVSFFACFFKP